MLLYFQWNEGEFNDHFVSTYIEICEGGAKIISELKCICSEWFRNSTSFHLVGGCVRSRLQSRMHGELANDESTATGCVAQGYWGRPVEFLLQGMVSVELIQNY